LVLVALAAACAAHDRGFDVPEPLPEQDMTLGPGDTFEVAVFDDKELSGKYRVANDGTINFPLIGAVEVGGRAPKLVEKTIQEALKAKQLLRNPSVSIFVLEYSSKRVNVMGAVQRPGSMPWTSGMGVLQAVSGAGGLTPLAAGNDTIVTRQEAGKRKRYRVSVRRISEGQERDFLLRTGDIIFVPERIF
jgi:protein involved in polysaccharide export with SLBB domain